MSLTSPQAATSTTRPSRTSVVVLVAQGYSRSDALPSDGAQFATTRQAKDLKPFPAFKGGGSRKASVLSGSLANTLESMDEKR